MIVGGWCDGWPERCYQLGILGRGSRTPFMANGEPSRATSVYIFVHDLCLLMRLRSHYMTAPAR